MKTELNEIDDKNKPVFTPEQEKEMLELYSLGATDWQVHNETGYRLEDITYWRAWGDNNARIVDHQDLPPWRAKKILHKPKNFEEAKWLATHHPDMKRDYSDRVEHTGKDGEDLFPKPLLGGASTPAQENLIAKYGLPSNTSDTQAVVS